MNKYDVQNMIEAFIEETKDKLYEIEEVLFSVDEVEAKQAKMHWIAHILMALDNDHDYIGGSAVTAKETVDALVRE